MCFKLINITDTVPCYNHYSNTNNYEHINAGKTSEHTVAIEKLDGKTNGHTVANEKPDGKTSEHSIYEGRWGNLRAH